MVFNRKQQRKQRSHRGTKRFAAGYGVRKSKRTGMLQYGGVSPACVFNGASGADVLYRNAGANIHNTNPQASLDLDNKFMNYGGAVPLGSNILQGGAAKCGDEGRGGAGNGKSETFKQYLDGLANQYMIGGNNYMNNQPLNGTVIPGFPDNYPNIINKSYVLNPNKQKLILKQNTNFIPKQNTNFIPNKQKNPYIIYTPPLSSNSNSNNEPIPNEEKTLYNINTNPFSSTNSNSNNNGTNHTGGGFSTDPSEYIAGLPVYKAYDDCCPPAIVNNQLVQGAPDQPVCGLGAIKGGARRRSRKHKSSSKNKKNSRRNSKRKNNRQTRSRQERSQRGGDFVYSATKSTPSPYSDAFNGPQGVFRYPDDMKTRTFDEYQPNYSVNAI
jgi:hypothetical protein